MSRYSVVNKEAKIYTHPTSQIKKEDLDKLLAESKEDALPPTLRCPLPNY